MVRDPLGRMPDSYEVNLYGGPMTDVRTVTLIFDGVDVPTFPLVEDPVTGQPAVVQVEMVNFDIARVYAALGVPAGATINSLMFKNTTTLIIPSLFAPHPELIVVLS